MWKDGARIYYRADGSEVRPLREQDIDVLLDIVQNLSASDRHFLRIDTNPERLKELQDLIEEGETVYVMDTGKEDEIVGFFATKCTGEANSLHSLLVLEPYRQQGYGGMGLQYYSGKTWYTGIWVTDDNSAMISAMKEYGFVPTNANPELGLTFWEHTIDIKEKKKELEEDKRAQAEMRREREERKRACEERYGKGCR